MFEFFVKYSPSWILKIIANITNNIPFLRRIISEFQIKKLVDKAPHRPHPWSTVHSYISWSSLSNRNFSSRHLPEAPDLPANKLDIPVNGNVQSLFARPAGQQTLSDKSTCLFAAFAQYATDGFIQTLMPNTSSNPPEPQSLRKQNTSNHQVDLCSLYGNNVIQTNQLRWRSTVFGKRGRLDSQIIGGEEYPPYLYTDVNGTKDIRFTAIADPIKVDLILGSPAMLTIFAVGGDRVNAAPQVMMINTLLLREHNRLAGLLENANPSWDDDRVFETARNILIVIFIKIVVEEYIEHINPLPFKFVFEKPDFVWNAPWNKPNWISTEFSLLYRWHSLIPNEMTWNDIPYRPRSTFMNNPLFTGIGLIEAFEEISRQPAGVIGVLNTHQDLVGFEIRAIDQGRLCQLDSYAKYCELLGLDVPCRFSDVTKDINVQNFLASLYGDNINNLEFYAGIFAADRLPHSPLPELMLHLVAVDAFSQALTNPLLSEHVFYREDTFTTLGRNEINNTHSLRDLLVKQNPNANIGFVGMTQPSWKYS